MSDLFQRDVHERFRNRITIIDRQGLHDGILIHDNERIEVRLEDRGQGGVTRHDDGTRVGCHAIIPSDEMVPLRRLSRQGDCFSISDRVLEVHHDHTTLQKRIESEFEGFPLELRLNRQISRSHHRRESRLPTDEVVAHLLRRDAEGRLPDAIPIGDGDMFQRVTLA